MKLNELTITEAHQGLKKKEFSSEELTRDCLEQIKKENSRLNAFITVCENEAIAQAKKIDQKIAAGGLRHFLEGIPLAVKDNILVEGLKATAGSKILENYKAPYDATAIKKIKEAGAIILGKTNMDEFAMGSSTETSAFGPTRNPYDLNRVPGGSSGGSAAAVAANLCLGALGSDTGGSIRQPAAFCGIVGLKPTYGAVSRYGLIAMASSLDQIGPMTKNVGDAKILYQVIAGYDKMDSTSLNLNSKFKIQNSKLCRFYRASSMPTESSILDKVGTKSGQSKIQNLRIGVPKEYFVKGINKEVEKIIKNLIKKIENLGVKIETVSLPHTKYALACYYLIMPAEVSANLARYDGIRYSQITNHKSQITNLLDQYLEARSYGFGQEVKRRIMLGAYVLSSGYYEAYYGRAQKVRTLIKKDFEEVFKKVDFILTPTTPTVAFSLGEKTRDPLEMYLADIFTVAVNLAGLPAISIPCDKVNGLPAGLQIIANYYQENEILNLAETAEKLF